MAKKKPNESKDNNSTASTNTQGDATGGQPMPAWRVSVNCPTPLARNPAIVNAFDEKGAWDVFCAQNGIGGSDHPKTIEPATAAPNDAEADSDT